jgi:regulator of protease activity HflC (stomatin/prohibitin superfamily)
MSAERYRRATVTEADGKREAAVMVAEGERQARILQAQGEREAEILVAEGERQGRILRAEGFANGLEAIYQIAQGIDSKTMSLEYLDMLKQLGASEATKIVVPVEFTNMLQPLLNHTQQASQD